MDLISSVAEEVIPLENTMSGVDGEDIKHKGKGKASRHRCPKPGCGKSFSRPSHLARHALNHSAIEFECSRCRASFKRRDLLERHRARHASKDRLAGGLGLGILRTKRLQRRAQSPSSSRGQGASASVSTTLFAGLDISTAHERENSAGHSAALGHDATMDDDNVKVSNPRQSTQVHSTAPTASNLDVPEDPIEFGAGIFNADSFDFHEIGGMYHDANFDLLHFNVTGDLDGLAHLGDLYSSSIPADVSSLASNPFDIVGDTVFSSDLLDPLLTKSPTTGASMRSQSSEPDNTSPDPPPSAAWMSKDSEICEDSEDVGDSCSLGRLEIDHLHLTEMKRGEILGLLNDMRPVYPNGTLVDETTANLSLVQMQNYLNLFFSSFNYCYPLIHLATLQLSTSEPLFLLSMMVLGATYRSKEDHQLSVCIYDAMTPYIMSGLVSIKTPDLSILQSLMILECYGMYRAGSYQRENAILIHTFLFNAIRRLSRYHVRARIMVPTLMTTQEKDWKAFAHIEQYKRLILFVFMWDTQNVSYYSFMPTMSTQSIQVNLPCSKELWEAEDEETWKKLIPNHREPQMINGIVKDIVEDGGNIWCETFDGLSLNLILHGLMSMCNDMVHFNNQSIYLSNATEGESCGTPRRRRMSHALELWKTKYDAYAMETRQSIDGDTALHMFREESVSFLALYHTAHIVVNADVRHLQIAAGAKAIFGHVVTTTDQEESTEVVMQWVRLSPSSAGHAAWHAAQMIREGLLNLRDWKANGMFHYPWCLYVGALTCWAFAHFSRNQDGSDHQACRHTAGDKERLQAQSKPLMHQTVSNMASSTPENIGKVLNRCCPHGLAIEVAKHLKTVRWTAAFEAMKVLEGLADLEVPASA